MSLRRGRAKDRVVEWLGEKRVQAVNVKVNVA